jgi:penicillin amidase
MSTTIRDGRAMTVRVLLVALFALVLLALAAAAWFVRSPLPKLDGTIAVAGPTAAISIRRDSRGTPHIEAQTSNDALFGEGFACAQDRLWQMDTLRRQAEGRLSEFAGPAALDVDRYMRTLGLAAAAAADVRALDPQTRASLEAYAAGVNAAAASHRLPIEFRLLGYGWEPWRPEDTLAVAKLMAQRLDDQWYYIDVKARLIDKVGPQAADALVDMQIPKLEQYIPGYAAAKPLASQAGHAACGAQLGCSGPSEPRSEIAALLRDLPDWPRHDAGTGSNNWVVSGRRTSTQRPVLSNDTHLDHSLPSTWWIADLHGGDLHVAGFTLPGLPGIVVGHNERIAFGVTSAEEAVQDLYIERFRSADSDEYLANGTWRKARHRIERIGVKGQPDVVLDVLVTRHGPVIKRQGTRALALAWTILQRGAEARALTRIDTAANWPQFRAALAPFVGPVLNFAYADVDGHVGYQDAGAVPLRTNGDGSVPVEGEDDRYAWHGYVPFDALPHALDPTAGFVATANQALVPPTYRPLLSTYFEPPFRAHRIANRLAGIRDASPANIGAIQADTFDYPRWQLARVTARLLGGLPITELHGVARELGAWDGMMRLDARVPTFVATEERLLERDVLEPKFGTELYQTYGEHYWPIVPLLRVLDGDQRVRSIGLTRPSVEFAIIRAAREAMAELNVSSDLHGVQQWGAYNAAIYRHPLSAKKVLGFLSVPPVPQPGSGFAIYAGKPHHGPSERLVVDLADFDNSSMLLTLGESGQYSDPNYDDQLEDFVNVRYVPMPFSQAAVLAATKHTLILEPRAQERGTAR